jgi:hypothetical protein
MDFEEEEIKALLQIVNATNVSGKDARLIVKILDKLEEGLNPTSGEH